MGWDEEKEIKGLRIVIIQNLFSLDSFSKDLKEKTVKYIEDNIGNVERTKIFQNNPDGVMEIKFKKASDAEACIEEMNNKEFSGRVLKCFYYDGKTDYRNVKTIQIKESADEEMNRIQEFGKWLEEDSDSD